LPTRRVLVARLRLRSVKLSDAALLPPSAKELRDPALGQPSPLGDLVITQALAPHRAYGRDPDLVEAVVLCLEGCQDVRDPDDLP